MKNPYPSETGCCPRFQPEPYDEKEFQWEGRLFIKDKVRCIFNLPVGFGKAMVRNMERAEKADAYTPEPPLVLSDHTSKWNIDLYYEVAKEVPDAENVILKGTYLSKVFEGPFKDAGKWCSEMATWVKSLGKETAQTLMYYTTCPRCAKVYGKNYVVILAAV